MVVSRETENLAIVVATLIIHAEEREAFDAPGSAENYRDEVKALLRFLLGNRDPLKLWQERRSEVGALRGSKPPNAWVDMLNDEAWDGQQTKDAKEYRDRAVSPR